MAIISNMAKVICAILRQIQDSLVRLTSSVKIKQMRQDGQYLRIRLENVISFLNGQVSKHVHNAD